MTATNQEGRRLSRASCEARRLGGIDDVRGQHNTLTGKRYQPATRMHDLTDAHDWLALP